MIFSASRTWVFAHLGTHSAPSKWNPTCEGKHFYKFWSSSMIYLCIAYCAICPAGWCRYTLLFLKSLVEKLMSRWSTTRNKDFRNECWNFHFIYVPSSSSKGPQNNQHQSWYKDTRVQMCFILRTPWKWTRAELTLNWFPPPILLVFRIVWGGRTTWKKKHISNSRSHRKKNQRNWYGTFKVRN